jgi:hypothetical protein
VRCGSKADARSRGIAAKHVLGTSSHIANTPV